MTSLEQQLALSRDAGKYLSVLMTMDNKQDYDRIHRSHKSSQTPCFITLQKYMERSSKRALVYKALSDSLLDVIVEHEWTNLEQINAYLNKAYFERVADDIGEILA